MGAHAHRQERNEGRDVEKLFEAHTRYRMFDILTGGEQTASSHRYGYDDMVDAELIMMPQ
jgi:hypothetical protein